MCKNSLFCMVGVVITLLTVSCQSGPDPKTIVSENTNPGVVITRNDDASTVYIRVFVDGTQMKLYGQHDTRDLFEGKETSGNILPNGRHTIYFDAYYRFEPGATVDKTEIIPLLINNDRHFFEVKWDSNRKKLEYAIKETVKITGGAVAAASGLANPLDEAIKKTFDSLSAAIPENGKIALVNMSSANTAEGAYIFEELTRLLVNSGKYSVVDRQTLDTIRQEQAFQMSGEVADDSAIDIGNFLGADIVLTGSVSGENEFKRLRVKALDVKTTRILANTSESLD